MAAIARRLLPVLLAAALSLIARPADAQDWVLTAAAGKLVHESLGGRVGTLGTTASLGYHGPLSLYLSGGAPLDTAGVFWGAAGAGGRVLHGTSRAIGVDAGADLVTFADASWDAKGWGNTFEVMPLVRFERGVGALELRTGVQQYHQSFSGESTSRTLHMSDARASVAFDAFHADGELRYARASNDAYRYAGVTADYTGSAGGVWASLGRWFDGELDGTGWGAGVQLTVAPLGVVFASYAAEGWDPLYRNQPRTSWNVGITRRIGPIPPVLGPVEGPEVRSGSATFSVTADAAPGPISIAGDFTGWETVAMEQTGGGWTITLPVRSGVYRYAFRDANGEWFVPSTVPDRVDDGFGGVSAVLVVP